MSSITDDKEDIDISPPPVEPNNTQQLDTDKIKQLLSPFTIIIGLLPAICGVSSILYCYQTTIYTHNHLPEWLWMPVISLLGCKEPESTYYQIGFGITGLVTLLFFFTFQTSILQYIPNKFADEKSKLKWTVLAAAFGVFGQGVITMEESAIEGITNVNADNEVQWKPGTQSIIHQLLAAVFFISAMFHGWSAITVYSNCQTEPIKSLVLSKYFKILSFTIPLLFQFSAFVYHPISGGTKTQNDLNKAGLGQWLTVFSYLAFFASYAVDHISIQWTLKTMRNDNKKSQ
eukprot:925599_1